MMSTTLTEHDNSVVEQLKQLPVGTTTADKFAQALKLGASPVLLEHIAARYTASDPHDSYKIVGLPYIGVLLANGWSLAQVRDFVSTMCFTEGNFSEDSYHRDGFWNDEAAWLVFETAEQLMAFLRQFAAKSPRQVLTEDGHNKLAEYFDRLNVELRQNQRFVRELEQVAILAARHIENEWQLNIAIRVAVPMKGHEQLAMAVQLYASAWNLVFMGYVLAKHGSHTYEGDLVLMAIHHQLERAPRTTPAVYRWLAEGYRRADNQWWSHRLEGSTMLRGIFTTRGWQFIRTTATPQGAIQVILPDNHRIIVRHQPGDEEVKANDEVLFHRDQLKDFKPIATPAGKVYTLRLLLAMPATADMLAASTAYFYCGYKADVWKSV